MTTILRATIEDAPLLSTIAGQAYMESHGHSASATDNASYITNKLSTEAFTIELSSPENSYHIVYVDQQPAGYSKIILNARHPDIGEEPVTKLERLYLLKSFYGQDIGKQLFEHNVSIAKAHHQLGMWLHVWKENHRAFAFYQRQGFNIIGSYEFEISPTHFNPNHVMYLRL